MKKVIRIFIMSAITCFSLTFSLVIINAIMKVFIGIEYYFMIFSAMTLFLTIGLVLFNSKKIFAKKKKVHRNAKARNVKRKSNNNQQSEIRKRKIS